MQIIVDRLQILHLTDKSGFDDIRYHITWSNAT